MDQHLSLGNNGRIWRQALSPQTLPALVLLAFFLQGCLSLSPHAELERLKAERGAPDSRTVFRDDPGPNERPLAELEQTLRYWTESPSGAGERWRGVLVPQPEDLYDGILERIGGGASSFTLVAYRFDRNATLVDYLDESGALLGWDHVALPAENAPPGGPGILGFFNLAWWEYPQMLLLDLPVYLALGAKELAGEAIKSPLSMVEAGLLGAAVRGQNPFSPVSLERSAGAFWEDWRNGFTAFLWRFRVRSRHTPLDLARDLAAAIPVVGPVFAHKSPPVESVEPTTTALIVLSGGAYEGGENDQYLGAWKRAVEEQRPDVIVTTAPYRHGGVFDTLWSVLNISHGAGHDLAARIVFDEGVHDGDGVEILGLAGGTQRALAASRALRPGGVTVNKLIGIAGPMGGNACAVESWNLVAESPFEDSGSFSAFAVDLLYALFPSNVAVTRVRAPGGGGVPYFPDPATRAPQLGYSRRLEALLGR